MEFIDIHTHNKESNNLSSILNSRQAAQAYIYLYIYIVIIIIRPVDMLISGVDNSISTFFVNTTLLITSKIC